MYVDCIHVEAVNVYILTINVFRFSLSHLYLPPSHFQACGDAKAKPSYLVDKNLESAVKFIVRKFPAVETRNNNVSTCVLSLTVFEGGGTVQPS